MHEPGELSLELDGEGATREAGAVLARALKSQGVGQAMITLAGELGAGKTTLARGFLEALGAQGPVRSPTYTLIESYPVSGLLVHHLDWYRLGSAADLEGLGFRDLEGPGQWILIEWPERAPSVAARADLSIALDYSPAGRRARVRARASWAGPIVAALRRATA
jgi:tRNA threonylcarbamoyladenosine biosynthesis protein TsaE